MSTYKHSQPVPDGIRCSQSDVQTPANPLDSSHRVDGLGHEGSHVVPGPGACCL